jgi:hypothetical protein
VVNCQPADNLIVDYENEGKIDGSMASCIADGTVPGRNSVENERFARLLCDARNRHIEAYQGLQSAYRRFLHVISQDSGARRMNVPISIAHLRVMIKSCIEHKQEIALGRCTAGGM